MPTLLTDLVLDEISLVDIPANPGAEILLWKRHSPVAAVIEKAAAPEHPAVLRKAAEARMAEVVKAARRPGEAEPQVWDRLVTDTTSPFGRVFQRAAADERRHRIEADRLARAEAPALAAKRNFDALVRDIAAERGISMAEAFSAAVDHPVGKVLRAASRGV